MACSKLKSVEQEMEELDDDFLSYHCLIPCNVCGDTIVVKHRAERYGFVSCCGIPNVYGKYMFGCRDACSSSWFAKFGLYRNRLDQYLGHECTEEDVEFVQRVQSSKWIQISNELQDEIAGLNRRIAELESKNAKQLKKVRSVERKKFDEQLKTIMKNAEKRNSETNFKNGVFAATTVVGIVILALYCV